MKLECTAPFGNTVPGDVVEVPDGAAFDGAYYRRVEETKTDKKADKE